MLQVGKKLSNGGNLKIYDSLHAIFKRGFMNTPALSYIPDITS
jgi:hypothetical protein